MSKYRILDPVRVTDPGSRWFDQVLTVRIITGTFFWAQSADGPELIAFQESDLTLADREREAAQ